MCRIKMRNDQRKDRKQNESEKFFSDSFVIEGEENEEKDYFINQYVLGAGISGC